MAKARPPKTNFDHLKDEWYRKLKESGFDDIESDEQHLKTWSSRFQHNHTVDEWQAKAAYYSMASSFLNDYKFASKLERSIWEYHANGISIRNIAAELKKLRLANMARDTVWSTIKRLRENMRKMYALPTDDEYFN